MSVAIVTGSSGLIGSQAVRFLSEKGLEVVGIDNNARRHFFGTDGCTDWVKQELLQTYPRFTSLTEDIKDTDAMAKIFKTYGQNLTTVIHCAAQPSHDWAAKDPLLDFNTNALGTLNLLEAFRQHAPQASFILTSTNKVYGDTPNNLPLEEQATRFEIAQDHAYFERGIDETMSIDASKHSLFGCSKLSADVYVQEYGRYFGLNTGIFRGGCLTGPAHSGAELHGFLSYLAKCIVRGKTYTVFGHGGKQVRDNIHSWDLVNAFWHFIQAPRQGEVYNIGGSRYAHSSLLEAVAMIESICGREAQLIHSSEARSGDHMWWVSDVSHFRSHFPDWHYRYSLQETLEEIVAALGTKGSSS